MTELVTIREQLIEELKESGFKQEQIIAADESRACYGYDATRQTADPMLVLLPENRLQVECALRLAANRS